MYYMEDPPCNTFTQIQDNVLHDDQLTGNIRIDK